MPRPKKTAKASVNKSAFVRSLPTTMSAVDVVKAAKAKGINVSEKYVHTIRYNAKISAKKKGGGGAAPAKRGPGRPRKVASAGGGGGAVGNGLVGAIERLVESIVEQKVSEALRSKLGSIFKGA